MQQKTILIIEDDLPLREAAQMKLEKAGFKVLATSSAEEGIKLLSSNTADFIWLDVLLPGMSGLSFLEYLRESEVYKNLPVMIVSASANPSKVKRALELNVVDFVTKTDRPLRDIVSQVTGYLEKPVS